MKNPLIILNPAARSEKAGLLSDRLASLCEEAEIRLSGLPGDAEKIAREAVLEGYTTIVAAGPTVQNVSLTGAIPIGIVGDAGRWVKKSP